MAVRVPWADSIMWANVRLLSIAGVWPPPDGPSCYLLYTWWLFFSQCLMIAGQLMGLWRFRDDMDKITLDICLTVTVVMGVSKGAVIVAKKDEFFRVVNHIDSITRIQREAGHSEIVSVLESSFKLSRTLTVYLPVVGGMSPVMWGLNPLLMSVLGDGSGERLLPVVCWYSSLDTVTPFYEVLYAVQFVTVQGGYLVVMGSDLFFVSLMIHTAAQLHILNLRLKEIVKMSDEGTDITFDSTGKRPASIYYNPDIAEWGNEKMVGQLMKHITTDSSESTCHEELRLWIEQHKQIIKLVQDLEHLLSVIILFQFLGGTIIICVTLFQSSAKAGDFAAMFKLLLYLGTMLSQIFLYCWYADGIIQQSSRLSESVYACGWPDAPQPVRRALLIIMRRSQRPLRLTAGKFYYISRGTFVSLVNAAYSYYALLRQMNVR